MVVGSPFEGSNWPLVVGCSSSANEQIDLECAEDLSPQQERRK